ncbi:MAG: 3D domain-containing protein [Acidobacteriota bacterium]
MSQALVRDHRLSYYFPGIVGFIMSFVTIVVPCAYRYQMRQIEVARRLAQPPINSVMVTTNLTAPTLSSPTASIEAIKTPPAETRANELLPEQKFRPGKIMRMEATAYCINNVTASGVRSKYGILAADPRFLPIGSIVRLYADEYTGLYTVLDTGEKIKGRKIDIYLSNYQEACRFGRRKVRLEILRYGWDPQASSSAF